MMNVQQIKNLKNNMYKPIIKCRVAAITGTKQFKKDGNKSGYYFNFEVEDSSGSIQGVCYEKDMLNQLDVAKYYEIKNFIVRKAKKQCKHEFELLFHKTTVINESPDTTVDVKKTKFKFVEEILNSDSNITDVIGIIGSVSESKEVPTKKGTEILKKEIVLHDHNLSSIDLILWGDQTTLLEKEDENVVISISNAIKSTYMDQNQLSLAWNSHIDKNPESSEATKLYTWLIERKDLD